MHQRVEKGGDGESRPLGRGCGRRRRRGGGWWTEAVDGDEVGRPRDGNKRRALVTALTDLTAAGGRLKPPRGRAAPLPPSLPPATTAAAPKFAASNQKFIAFLTCLAQIPAPVPAADPRAPPLREKEPLIASEHQEMGRKGG